MGYAISDQQMKHQKLQFNICSKNTIIFSVLYPTETPVD